MESLFLFFFIIIVLIVISIKNFTKYKDSFKKRFLMNHSQHDSFGDDINNYFTKEQAIQDAENYFKSLTKDKIHEYAKQEERFIIIKYSIFLICTLLFSSLILYFVQDIFTLIFTLTVFLIIIMLIVYFFISQFNKSEETLATLSIQKRFIKLYKEVIKNKIFYLTETTTYSKLYSNLIKLNDKYDHLLDDDFYDYDDSTYEFSLKSRKAVENYDFDKSFNLIIKNNLQYYENLVTKYQKLVENYKKYEEEYQKINFSTKEDVLSKINYSFEIFHNIEKFIYTKYKYPLSPEPMVFIEIEYESPAGNVYENDSKSFSFMQICNKLNDLLSLEKKEKINLKNQQFVKSEKLFIKEQKKELKRKEEELKIRQKEIQMKEKLFSNLKSYENQINKKANELLEKELSFKQATNDHIYNNDPTTIEEPATSPTIYEQLKSLRKQFENGELSKEEFEKKRKELM